MGDQNFQTGNIVVHVHPGFAGIKLYVVKKLDNGSYKCRYLKGDQFHSDEFEPEEIKYDEPKPEKKLDLRALSGL